MQRERYSDSLRGRRESEGQTDLRTGPNSGRLDGLGLFLSPDVLPASGGRCSGLNKQSFLGDHLALDRQRRRKAPRNRQGEKVSGRKSPGEVVVEKNFHLMTEQRDVQTDGQMDEQTDRRTAIQKTARLRFHDVVHRMLARNGQ